MKGASQLAPLGIRIPDELKAKIQDRAANNGRSMNAEIIDVIEKSFSGGDDRHDLMLQGRLENLEALIVMKDKMLEYQGNIIESMKGTISAQEKSINALEKHLDILRENIEFLKNLNDNPVVGGTNG